ncbi:MAG: hypothetical protein AAF492_29895 [Verrucomicrobiota bacterium]
MKHDIPASDKTTKPPRKEIYAFARAILRVIATAVFLSLVITWMSPDTVTKVNRKGLESETFVAVTLRLQEEPKLFLKELTTKISNKLTNSTSSAQWKTQLFSTVKSSIQKDGPGLDLKEKLSSLGTFDDEGQFSFNDALKEKVKQIVHEAIDSVFAHSHSSEAGTTLLHKEASRYFEEANDKFLHWSKISISAAAILVIAFSLLGLKERWRRPARLGITAIGLLLPLVIILMFLGLSNTGVLWVVGGPVFA